MQNEIEYKRPSFHRRFIARFFLDNMIIGLSSSMLFDKYFNKPQLIFIILPVYYFLSLILFNKTIGDKLLKIELISLENNNKVRWHQVLIRILLMPIALIHYIVYNIFNTICFWLFIKDEVKSNPKLIHDKIANTDMRISEGVEVSWKDFVKSIVLAYIFFILFANLFLN
ncbi:RDD family protein [Orenia metallireducens]|uniref:RDD family protein n=1 Tax=Orenia metallireducens TaxID=1413210 RepID=A0A285I901_9FIRM|nr:RDD family protein [Orenia metallireducens]PRX21693.1 RDD family protein [Orenia metallireducens]SNY44444.1 RDD family protein [Orenia metallireducens]